LLGSFTHDAVLDAEAQLVPEVRPADEHHGDGGTPDDVQLDPGLSLEALGGGGRPVLRVYGGRMDVHTR